MKEVEMVKIRAAPGQVSATRAAIAKGYRYLGGDVYEKDGVFYCFYKWDLGEGKTKVLKVLNTFNIKRIDAARAVFLMGRIDVKTVEDLEIFLKNC